MTTEKKRTTKKKAPAVRAVEPAVKGKPWWEPLIDWFRGVLQTVWAWSWAVSIFIAAFLGLSLATYHPGDPSFFVSTSTPPHNFCALAGSWTSAALFETFGMSAWWFVLGTGMIAVFAIRAMYRRYHGETDARRLNPPKFSSAFGFLVLLTGSTCLEALRLRRFHFELPGEPGGILGDTLAFGILPYIGIGLSTVVFFTLIAIGLSLLMDFEWGDVCEKVGGFISRYILQPLTRLMQYCRQFKEQRAEKARVRAEMHRENTPFTTEPLSIVTHETGDDRAGFEPELTAGGDSLDESVRQVRVAPIKTHSPTPVLSVELLDKTETAPHETDTASLEMTSRLIVSKLKSYHVDAAVRGVQTGPVITQYWLEPGPGVKGQAIEKVREDLRRALGVQAVRVVPNVPGTSYIGLEVPNAERETVRLREVLDSPEYQKSRAPLMLALGKDIAGRPVTVDLAKMPHLLVAGTTGSGKSVGINAMILSMLFRNSPDQLRLVLIDPKMLEFSPYNDIPHLLCPVVTDMNKASTALKWLTREMDRRYEVMSAIGVRHFNTYNERVLEARESGESLKLPVRDPAGEGACEVLDTWPFIVCIVDELADLMLTNRKEVEGEITRLTQKARAAGIHLIIATQRPSVDVVTSLIKANVPTRLAFQVASGVDSRVILNESGAESLLGWGDMLFHRPGMQQATRIQGCFVEDNEVLRVVAELKKMGKPEYVLGVTEGEDGDDEPGSGVRQAGESDPLYDKAVDIVLRENRPSISFLQRQLGIGYNRAATIIEAMEAAGILTAPNNKGQRQVLVSAR